MRSDRDGVEATIASIEQGYAELAAQSFDTLTHSELLALQSRLEAVAWTQPSIMHKLVARLAAETSPVELGGKSWTDVLSNRLRISRGEARRRLDEAEDLGPRRALTGEPLAPALPNVAAAQAAGAIGAEHVRIIRRFFAGLPAAVDYQTRQGCEATLARIARELTPDALRKAADRLMALVHPDGDFSDADRTLQELESGCGQAVTATGSLVPMPTLIRLASHAHHYLTIFDKDTGRALHLGRTRRIASADQRIVLYASTSTSCAP